MESLNALLSLIVHFWPGMLFLMLAYLSLELMEHSRDDNWPPEWTVGSYNIGRKWFNTGFRSKRGEAFRNKHQWGKGSKVLSFLLDGFFVFLTDAEHFFQFLIFVFVALAIGQFTANSQLGSTAFLCLAVFGGALKWLFNRVFPSINLR